YREELRRIADQRTALAEAWTHTATTILASNLTVVLSLLSLVFAVIPGTRGLGITAAVGLIISAAAVLIALPPGLASGGKKMSWPFVPQVRAAVTVRNAEEGATPAEAAPHSVRELGDRAAGEAASATPSVLRRIATRVVRKPWLHLGAGIVILGL